MCKPFRREVSTKQWPQAKGYCVVAVARDLIAEDGSADLLMLFFDHGKRFPDFLRGVEPAPNSFQWHPPGSLARNSIASVTCMHKLSYVCQSPGMRIRMRIAQRMGVACGGASVSNCRSFQLADSYPLLRKFCDKTSLTLVSAFSRTRSWRR